MASAARERRLIRANLKLQIKNTEVEIHILFEKLDHLTDKLKKLVASGKNKKQKSQKR